MLRSAIDIMTFRAFRPDIRNSKVSYAERLAVDSRPLLGLSLNRSSAQLRVLKPSSEGKSVSVAEEERLDFATDEALLEGVVAYCRKHHLEHAIGLLSDDIVMEVQSVPSVEEPDDGRMLREDPSQLLGQDVESDYLYSLIRLPDGKQGLTFAYRKSAVDRLERLSRNAPFSFLQITSGIELTLARLFENVDKLGSGDSRELRDVIIQDHPTLAIVQFAGRQLLPVLFCRTDVADLPPDESAMVINALQRYVRPDSRVNFFDLGGKDSEDRKRMLQLLEETVGAERYHVSSEAHPIVSLLTSK